MSLFEGEGYPLPLNPELRVLILGQGGPADKALDAVKRAGGKPVRVRGDITGISGLAGNFRVLLESGDNAKTLSVGAVVLAFEAQVGAVPEISGKLVMDPAQAREADDLIGAKVALLTGFWSQTGPGSLGRVLDLGLEILAKGGNSFLFTPQAKVAAPTLEAGYRRFREQGGLVTRIEQSPELEPVGDKVRAVFKDPVLDQEVSITLDKVVCDPPLTTPEEMGRLGSVLGLDLGPDGWPNPDNVLFPAPLTSRAGVFALGGTDGFDPVGSDQESELLEEHLRRLFNPRGGIRAAARTAAEKRECAVCLTCLRTCPVQAIGWDKGPVVLEAACLNCGQCAGVCPAAIIRPLWPEEEALKILLAEPGQGDLVLACGRVNEDILDGLPVEVRAVRLSCAGRVGQEILFRLLALGYDRVFVAACHPGNCRSLTGTERAGKVVRAVRAELKDLGLDPRSVAYLPLAPHQGSRLYGALGLGGG